MSSKIHASEFLEAGLAHMQDRAVTYDKQAQGGERSMGATVSAFNAATGHSLTDGAAYFGLMGEAASARAAA